jgi:hypothetical protein
MRWKYMECKSGPQQRGERSYFFLFSNPTDSDVDLIVAHYWCILTSALEGYHGCMQVNGDI